MEAKKEMNLKGESSKKRSPLGECMLKLARKYPYGMAVSFVQSACEKELPSLTVKESTITKLLYKPPKTHQMTGLETIVFGPVVGKVVPPVESLAWMIFHRLQILVSRSSTGNVQVDQLDDLMMKTFGRSFPPEVWGFPDFTYFYNFLFKHFQLYHNTAVLRTGRDGTLFLSGSHPFVGDVLDCTTSTCLSYNISFYTKLVMDSAKRKN